VFAEYARVAFLKTMSYRLRYVTGILSYLVYVSANAFIWRAVFADAPGSAAGGPALGGFDAREMTTYVAVGWIARSFYFNNVDREIAEDVSQGRIATALLRPFPYQAAHVAQALGESLFRGLFFSAPIAVLVALLFPVAPPASAAGLAAFLLSALLGFLVLAALNFLVGVFAIHMQSILGVIRAKQFVLDVFSGLLIPIPLFPGALRAVAEALPFRQVAYVPATIYLGRMPLSDVLPALAGQAAWAAVLLALGALVFRLSSAKVAVQGG
jgi:ABC-2 type transport system permease protein